MQKAVKRIMDGVTDECVITSCGYISREVYAYKDRPRNFYLLGAMGSALSFGLGLAFQRPDLKVVVIQGDGATLMSMGTIALFDELSLPNIKLHILNNDSYASTGGQPTCFDMLNSCNYLCGLDNVEVITCGKYSTAPRVPLSPTTIKERFFEDIRLKEK